MEKNNDLVVVETNGKKFELTHTDVKKYICEKATEKEIHVFLQICKAQNLNPFIREAYLIKYNDRSPATIVVGKETFLKRAMKSAKYSGHVVECEGSVDKKNFRDSDMTATAKVHMNGFAVPITVTVDYVEYVGVKKDYHSGVEAPNSMWKSKPKTMLKKVALMQALREAFPDDCGGLYEVTEINSIDEAEAPLPTGVIVKEPIVEKKETKAKKTKKEKIKEDAIEAEVVEKEEEPVKEKPKQEEVKEEAEDEDEDAGTVDHEDEDFPVPPLEEKDIKLKMATQAMRVELGKSINDSYMGLTEARGVMFDKFNGAKDSSVLTEKQILEFTASFRNMPSSAQIKKLMTTITSIGMDYETAGKDILQAKWGVRSSKDLSKSQISEVIEYFTELKGEE